jgi:hypothetical protein
LLNVPPKSFAHSCNEVIEADQLRQHANLRRNTSSHFISANMQVRQLI